MNILDIDAGNTRLKWRVVTAGRVLANGVCHNDKPSGMVTALAKDLTAAGLTIGGCRLASVKSRDYIDALVDAVKLQLEVVPRQPDPVNGLGGLWVEKFDPRGLGVDRWLAMLGALSYFPGRMMMVVDAGTALTLDVIDGNGLFQGGLICPGLQAMLKAMADSADLLLIPSKPNLQRGLTHKSIQAVQNGAVTMTVSLIEREFQRLQGDVLVLLCGGDAQTLAKYVTIPARVQADLVFRGLEVALPSTSGE